MEKLINFTSTANSGPFKNVVGKTNMGYYSEEDISKESTPENKEETKTNNNTVLTTSKLSNIKLRGGYETEDSDDSLTPDKKSLTSDSKTAKGMSSFFVYKGVKHYKVKAKKNLYACMYIKGYIQGYIYIYAYYNNIFYSSSIYNL